MQSQHFTFSKEMASKLRSPPPNYALVLILHLTLSSSSVSATEVSSSKEFIVTQCKDTEDPALCFEILSPYADTVQHDPVQLARAAAQVALDRVRAVASAISKIPVSPTDPAEVKELQSTCNEELGYAVDEIEDAMKELEAAKGLGPGTAPHADEARQHMDTASTNAISCAEEFDAEEVEGAASLKEARKEMRVVLAYTDNAYRLAHHLANHPSS